MNHHWRGDLKTYITVLLRTIGLPIDGKDNSPLVSSYVKNALPLELFESRGQKEYK